MPFHDKAIWPFQDVGVSQLSSANPRIDKTNQVRAVTTLALLNTDSSKFLELSITTGLPSQSACPIRQTRSGQQSSAIDNGSLPLCAIRLEKTTMCYSALVWADYRKYVKQFHSKLSILEFVELFRRRANGDKVSIPKGMEAAFAEPHNEDERSIQAMITAFAAAESTHLEQELFSQRTRLVEAERKLQVKLTEAATDSQRIASNKIARAMVKLADLRRTDPKDSDSRIYPSSYAPVMVMEDGQRIIKPMRYQCRPAGQTCFL